MTKEEAIAVLENEIKCVDKDCDIERSCGSCPYAMPSKEPILMTYRMAIKSLETWDKVINEIKEMIEFNSEGDYISEAGCGMEDCLGVIKKYIEEVEK